jgi:hypothetical protein
MEPACFSSRCASRSKSATKVTTRKGIASAVPFLLNSSNLASRSIREKERLKFIPQPNRVRSRAPYSALSPSAAPAQYR